MMSSNGLPINPVDERTFDILPQPNDETCGATCLHAMYKYYGKTLDLHDLISAIPALETGGTIASVLGANALKMGFDATIFTYNLNVFDPTWFNPGVDLKQKLTLQLEAKKDTKLHWASKAYLNYLELGGQIKYEELTSKLLRRFLDHNKPILTGLNATYLYRCPREFRDNFDDIRGTSMGHFVILFGYDELTNKISVADPLATNPVSHTHVYHLDVDRVLNSILLGILTYDANLLVIESKGEDGIDRSK